MMKRRSFLGAGAGFLAAAVFSAEALAQQPPAPASVRAPLPENSLKYLESVYLAYVPSGIAAIDDVTRQGLEALAKRLNEKAGIEPKGVVAVDPAKDDLTLFRFIYWPVTENARALNAEAQQRVQNHINTGGLIVFDLRDESGALKKLLANISVRPLVKMPENHTVTRTFYKLQGLPGTKTLGDVFVEASGAEGSGGSSSVIIGSHEWVDAWAGKTLHPQSRSYELAMRAGINQVVYAYTGRYKDNLILVPKTINQLGK